MKCDIRGDWECSGVSYDGASTAIAAFLFVFISNFAVEFVSLAVRYGLGSRGLWAPRCDVLS